MQREGVSPNKVTFLFAFQACGILADRADAIMVNGCPIEVVSLEIGEALRVDAKYKGFTTNGSSLVSMYGKCGAVLKAEAESNGLPECDIVTWTATLLAEVLECKALQFYRRMRIEGGILQCEGRRAAAGVQRTGKAVVVGGGWAGFVATHGLAKVGLSVTLLNAASDPGGLSTGFRTSQSRPAEAGIKGFWYYSHCSSPCSVR
ncbi:hypothetical protein L7F22_034712 [Adiantum nelumboides]|nr:hypothetical protein [Adiantum nelumboides]